MYVKTRVYFGARWEISIRVLSSRPKNAGDSVSERWTPLDPIDAERMRALALKAKALTLHFEISIARADLLMKRADLLLRNSNRRLNESRKLLRPPPDDDVLP